ncbi:MAG: flagellar hook-basal body complex protein FliE [Bacteroidetes bacterium]|nr:flagellar hook-basal body complex protein FliE [Bacteroidota bacterium]
MTKKPEASRFGDFLGGMIKDVNQTQTDAKKITENFIAGKDVQIHEVMIAGEKAKTSLQLLMEIRNKTMDMYRELTKMQG